MPKQATPDQQETTSPSPVEGGRACPLPADVLVLRGPHGMGRRQRSFVSTGVITADVLERTFS